MRLVINRSQEGMKGVFGGNKGVQFTLAYRLQFTSEEEELIERYKLNNYTLTWINLQSANMPDDTIANMRTGRSQSIPNVVKLISNERIVRDACDQLPILFEVCRSFGGEEVIEYPRPPADRSSSVEVE